MSDTLAMSNTLPVLNVSGSLYPHANAQIVGNPEGLRKLRQAIDMTLAHAEPTDIEFVDSEGEYYDMTVQVCADMSDQKAPYSWR